MVCARQSSGVGGCEGSGGPGEFVISGCLDPLYQKKLSPDFYVSLQPHWAAQGGVSGPLDPYPRPAKPTQLPVIVGPPGYTRCDATVSLL